MESKYFCAKSNGKLNYWHTILTGFGFMASSIAWAIYDPYITKILNRLLNESAVITSWSAKLNEAFPALASFAEANGEDVGTAAGGITLVPLFIGIIMTFDNIFGVIFQPTVCCLRRADLRIAVRDNSHHCRKVQFARLHNAFHNYVCFCNVAVESTGGCPYA